MGKNKKNKKQKQNSSPEKRAKDSKGTKPVLDDDKCKSSKDDLDASTKEFTDSPEKQSNTLSTPPKMSRNASSSRKESEENASHTEKMSNDEITDDSWLENKRKPSISSKCENNSKNASGNDYKRENQHSTPPNIKKNDGASTSCKEHEENSSHAEKMSNNGNSDDWWHKNKAKPSISSPRSNRKKDEASTSCRENENWSRNSSKVTAFDIFVQKMESERFPKEFKVVQEIDADLFGMPADYSLAHCVAEDLNMGAGIAVQFRQDFKCVGKLLDQRQRQGGMAMLEHKGRFIYYLITKRKSSGKPTYETLFRSLNCMKRHIVEKNVAKLAMPLIGCGLDRLDWNKVKPMIEYVFEDTQVKITICNFQQDDDETWENKSRLLRRKCRVESIKGHIEQATHYSIIIYLGAEDGWKEENLSAISAKYPQVMRDYTAGPRRVGEVVYTDIENYKYYAAGCIVKKRASDCVIFEAFEECIRKVNQKNVKFANDRYETVAIGTYEQFHDYIFMSKLVNVLSNTFVRVTIEIYDCSNL